MPDEPLVDVYANAPSNWGKWGDDDERGAINYLTESEVLRGIQAVEHGRVFSLGVTIGHPDGDPKTPSRPEAQHYMLRDRGHYESGKEDGDDRQGSDDVIFMATHGTTHVDALGHAWYGDALYNGFDPETTKGGLERCSIEPIAEHGVVGRGVLLDMARYRDVEYLPRETELGVSDLEGCAEAQGISLENRDILVIRTGWLERYYNGEKDAIMEYDEPGITYTDELVNWVFDMELPAYATDTFANERTYPEMGVRNPLHGTLIRDQGVLFNEITLLDELASDCAADEKYDFLYMCSPLKIVEGAGSPVNPLVIK